MKNQHLIIGVLAIIAGIIILIVPAILNWVVAIFLIVWGIVTIFGRR